MNNSSIEKKSAPEYAERPAGRHAAGRHAVKPAHQQAVPIKANNPKAAPSKASASRSKRASVAGHPAIASLFQTGKAGRRKSAMAKKPRKARRMLNRENLKTALWLWCFPVGLKLMWRRACTWNRGVKIGISAAMAAILLAIIIAPIPRANSQVSGIQMVSGNPEVEVYGPALPSLIVPGYTRESTGSIIVDTVESETHYVYAAEGARCYHEYDCKFAFASSQRLTVYEAYFLGYEPCGRCKPPVYEPGSELVVTTAAPDEEV